MSDIPRLAPIQTPHTLKRPWEGLIDKKPWEYNVTVIIPVLDTPEPLKTCVALLRAQTERPYTVIDTGSVESVDEINAMRAEDLEVHSIRSHAWGHASEPVSVAQDVGSALCRTEFLLSIHADAFLRKQTAVAELMTLAQEHKFVGFQISPRQYMGWETELGHTVLMTHMPTVRQHGITWNMRTFCERYNKRLSQGVFGVNCPDTETEFNHQLKTLGIKPLMLGTEQNRIRNINDWFDHPRSHSSAKLYDQTYYKKVSTDMANAIVDAQKRLQEWAS